MPKYYLAGLMYINGCEGNDQRVLIPDGDDRNIKRPLDATILVAKKDCKEGDTFGKRRERKLTVDGQEKEFYEFFLKKRSRITVPHSGTVQCSNLDTGLPRAQDAGFEPDLDNPETVAEIDLNSGSVTARSLAGIPIVEWVPGERNDGLEHDEPITITATLLDKDRKPTDKQEMLTVTHDASVVFLQSLDVFAEADEDDDDKDKETDPKSGSNEKAPPNRKYLDRAALYTKISRGRNPVDPVKLGDHDVPSHPQPDIPVNEQPDVLKALPGRPGWRTAEVPWCCAPPPRPEVP
jgi:hypothetical protein